MTDRATESSLPDKSSFSIADGRSSRRSRRPLEVEEVEGPATALCSHLEGPAILRAGLAISFSNLEETAGA